MSYILSLPNLDSALLERLFAEAEARRVDARVVAEEWLRRGAETTAIRLPEITPEDRAKLLAMAGSWTLEEAEAFDKATAHFSEIDQELWK